MAESEYFDGKKFPAVASMVDDAGVEMGLTQQTAEVDYAITWTTNEPTAGDSATIADGTVPTVAELGQSVADLTAKVNSLLAKLRTYGVIAS